MAGLSTHVLDSGTGTPAAAMLVGLEQRSATGWSALATAHTDSDGRIRDWGSDVIVTAGVFRLTFGTGEWFAQQGRECFYPEVAVTFSIVDDDGHFHVPLLLSAFAYSTYRGS
ncbi:hydroxyisourate hydrolase [Kineosporia sp. J2-2]|uniref:5-hydroxyisourate hydrolase n=1 Tax=Kineosporia corallincola TaxID=2835133 RepID=A0ABS5T8X9_9ACTN|nr:hydroxyisourate hydrolase [Kineosporia corallincola]MBT0767492.1 hydroxyisourate hydrolase [Kineosporia corallincola]